MASSNKRQSIAIFASGSGSNAQRILNYFSGHIDISVDLVLTNKADAGVIQKANQKSVPVEIISNEQSKKGLFMTKLMQSYQIDFIVLAGYLRLIPEKLIEQYPKQILNIHPALLPKYGGKGMYGHYVHQAVAANKEAESGMTIHYVNKAYDEGQIVFQARCLIEENDSSEKIAEKVLRLEHKYYASIIEQVIYASQKA